MDQLLQLGTTVHYRKNEVLIRPGDMSGALFVLVSGMVHVYTIEESGVKNIQIIYGPDDILPVARLIEKELSTVFYEALTDCEVIRLDASAARELVQREPKVGYDVLKQVVEQLMHYKLRVDSLEYKYARERIAYRLLQLAKQFGEKHGDRLVMYRFSQEEIGSMTNVSRENVGRELRRLEKMGCIAYADNKLEILSLDTLRKELAPIDSPMFIDDV